MGYDDRFWPDSGPRSIGRPEGVDVSGRRKATCDFRSPARIVDLQRVGLKKAKRIRKSVRKITWDNDLRRKSRKTVSPDFGGVLLGARTKLKDEG